MCAPTILLVAAERDRKESRHKYIFTLPLLLSYRMKYPKLEMDAIETRRVGMVCQVGHLTLPLLLLSDEMEKNWRRADIFQQQYIWILLSDGMLETGKECSSIPSASAISTCQPLPNWETDLVGMH